MLGEVSEKYDLPLAKISLHFLEEEAKGKTQKGGQCFLQLITDLRPPIPICEGWKLMVGEDTESQKG